MASIKANLVEFVTLGLSSPETGACHRKWNTTLLPGRHPASGIQGRVHYNHPFSAMPSGKIRSLPPRQKVPEPVNQVCNNPEIYQIESGPDQEGQRV